MYPCLIFSLLDMPFLEAVLLSQLKASNEGYYPLLKFLYIDADNPISTGQENVQCVLTPFIFSVCCLLLDSLYELCNEDNSNKSHKKFGLHCLQGRGSMYEDHHVKIPGSYQGVFIWWQPFNPVLLTFYFSCGKQIFSLYNSHAIPCKGNCETLNK